MQKITLAEPLTNAVTTAYDSEGHVVSQRGATYPVDYSYDEFGDKVSMTTYRDVNAAGDVTRWLRDEATGLVTNKVYADGKGPRYAYTPDGKLATRTWARGIVTTYSYDDNGALTNTVYSDGTPTISLAYNRAGRQIEAHDAAGVTTFLYDDVGSLTNETVVGVAGTNTIIRHWDNFGRSLGYSLVGRVVPNEPHRQSTLAYDPTTGRLATMQIPSEQSNNPDNQTIRQFSWNYLPGSDLKSSLSYPNGLYASWTYDANNQLLQVRNAFPTNVISQYDYTYDAAGRRIEVSKSGFAFTQDDTIAYGYNNRSELTNAVAAVDSDYRYDYDFDDIGNRETSSERGTNSVYTANNLNQYTLVGRVVPNAPQEEFIPQFDNDGNQTLVKTATGVWSVTYNGENRPVLWTLINSSTPNSSTPTLISMSYDRMGRRVTKNDQRFVYNGYLQIANFEHQTSNIKLQTFIWDPTEKIATRPLVWNFSTLQPFNFSTSYYTHDGNKNVSEVVAENGNIAAHYEYAPFGAVTTQCGAAAESNPWRFSSEYAEDETSTIYYNYRHYEPVIGKWLSRDPIEEDGGIINIYSYLDNTFGLYSDWIGQFPILPIFQAAFTSALKDAAKSFIISALTSWYDIGLDNGKLVYDAMMSCVNGDFDFHPINLYRPRDTSSLVTGFREALKDGFSSFITEALTGSLSEIIRGHASDFLKADPKSAYYEYFKKIEKFMKKDGVEELTDEMVKAISELAIIKVTDLSSLINSIDIVSDDEQMVKWTVKDKCRMCATVEESYTVTMTIMGEKQPSFVVPGPKTERCFDYDEIKSRGPVGREIISGCSLCPCKKK